MYIWFGKCSINLLITIEDPIAVESRARILNFYPIRDAMSLCFEYIVEILSTSKETEISRGFNVVVVSKEEIST